MENEKKANEQKVETAEKAQKRWIGKGIYGSKDIPIKILDGMIGLFVVMIIVFIIVFAIHGGYHVTFDTDGGSEIAEQVVEYGACAETPEIPVKPGYTFVKWVTSEDEYLAEVWDFSVNKVENDVTLYAVWEPAQITIKFDLDGGKFNDRSDLREQQVVYGEPYGALPIPEKEGFQFDGWIYSGQVIEETTVVFMTGEHVLTARWIEQE